MGHCVSHSVWYRISCQIKTLHNSNHLWQRVYVCHRQSLSVMDSLCLCLTLFLSISGRQFDKLYVISVKICPWDFNLSFKGIDGLTTFWTPGGRGLTKHLNGSLILIWCSPFEVLLSKIPSIMYIFQYCFKNSSLWPLLIKVCKYFTEEEKN